MRKKIAIAVILTSLLLGSLSSSSQAQEDPIRRFYREGAIGAAEARWQMWNSFSPRQKSLSRQVSAIADQFWTEYRQPIPMNSEALAIVMQFIGAQPSEADFVWSRMEANHNAAAVLPEVDNLIGSTERFLECLQRQGTGCIP